MPSSMRAPSIGHASLNSNQSTALVNRINEKRAEWENLKELRDLSAQLAGQMQMLEEKLATLSSGTEAVAAVLSNWQSVLGAIHMASMKIPRPNGLAGEVEDDVPLPQTLVRIPVE